MEITFISDTHSRHTDITKDLPGGDLLIHSGDFMNSGVKRNEMFSFCDWFNKLDDYDTKIFIAGNHDILFEQSPEFVKGELTGYKWIDYLQDEEFIFNDVKIYGSPWQPEFYNWAFNLPRRGPGLSSRWENIPNDTDILITHGPPQGILDISGPPYSQGDLGCELLRVRVDELKPKIHVFGHIHGSYGYKFINGTHFINASVLNEQYEYKNKPLTVKWDKETNDLTFL